MENVKEIISENLIQLRKSKNLTQIELAKKINYSDKAISRWEKGEVVPDLETLYALSEVFEVPISRILEKQTEPQEPEIKKSSVGQKILSQIFMICEIWLILCVTFAYLNITKHINLWQIFVWGIPATALILIFFNKSQNNINTFVCTTVFVWSLLACIYLHLLQANPWYIFFIGIPFQGLLIIKYVFNYKQKKTISLNNLIKRHKNKEQ